MHQSIVSTRAHFEIHTPLLPPPRKSCQSFVFQAVTARESDRKRPIRVMLPAVCTTATSACTCCDADHTRRGRSTRIWAPRPRPRCQGHCDMRCGAGPRVTMHLQQQPLLSLNVDLASPKDLYWLMNCCMFLYVLLSQFYAEFAFFGDAKSTFNERHLKQSLLRLHTIKNYNVCIQVTPDIT